MIPLATGMTNRDRSLICAGLTAALLAGCAGASDRYPSLAYREAERVADQVTPAAPPAVAPVATDEQIGSIAQRARGTHETFLREQGEALRLVRASRGLAPDSNARSRAEVGLAVLTSLHGQTALAMADLDALEVRAATTFAPTDGIGVAQGQVASFLSEQGEMLDSLRSEMDL